MEDTTNADPEQLRRISKETKERESQVRGQLQHTRANLDSARRDIAELQQVELSLRTKLTQVGGTPIAEARVPAGPVDLLPVPSQDKKQEITTIDNDATPVAGENTAVIEDLQKLIQDFRSMVKENNSSMSSRIDFLERALSDPRTSLTADMQSQDATDDLLNEGNLPIFPDVPDVPSENRDILEECVDKSVAPSKDHETADEFPEEEAAPGHEVSKPQPDASTPDEVPEFEPKTIVMLDVSRELSDPEVTVDNDAYAHAIESNLASAEPGSEVSGESLILPVIAASGAMVDPAESGGPDHALNAAADTSTVKSMDPDAEKTTPGKKGVTAIGTAAVAVGTADVTKKTSSSKPAAKRTPVSPPPVRKESWLQRLSHGFTSPSKIAEIEKEHHDDVAGQNKNATLAGTSVLKKTTSSAGAVPKNGAANADSAPKKKVSSSKTEDAAAAVKKTTSKTSGATEKSTPVERKSSKNKSLGTQATAKAPSTVKKTTSKAKSSVASNPSTKKSPSKGQSWGSSSTRAPVLTVNSGKTDSVKKTASSVKKRDAAPAVGTSNTVKKTASKTTDSASNAVKKTASKTTDSASNAVKKTASKTTDSASNVVKKTTSKATEPLKNTVKKTESKATDVGQKTTKKIISTGVPSSNAPSVAGSNGSRSAKVATTSGAGGGGAAKLDEEDPFEGRNVLYRTFKKVFANPEELRRIERVEKAKKEAANMAARQPPAPARTKPKTAVTGSATKTKSKTSSAQKTTSSAKAHALKPVEGAKKATSGSKTSSVKDVTPVIGGSEGSADVVDAVPDGSVLLKTPEGFQLGPSKTLDMVYESPSSERERNPERYGGETAESGPLGAPPVASTTTQLEDALPEDDDVVMTF